VPSLRGRLDRVAVAADKARKFAVAEPSIKIDEETVIRAIGLLDSLGFPPDAWANLQAAWDLTESEMTDLRARGREAVGGQAKGQTDSEPPIDSVGAF
jgi:plasmid maintenance system antidote protein VapI